MLPNIHEKNNHAKQSKKHSKLHSKSNYFGGRDNYGSNSKLNQNKTQDLQYGVIGQKMGSMTYSDKVSHFEHYDNSYWINKLMDSSDMFCILHQQIPQIDTSELNQGRLRDPLNESSDITRVLSITKNSTIGYQNVLDLEEYDCDFEIFPSEILANLTNERVTIPERFTAFAEENDEEATNLLDHGKRGMPLSKIYQSQTFFNEQLKLIAQARNNMYKNLRDIDDSFSQVCDIRNLSFLQNVTVADKLTDPLSFLVADVNTPKNQPLSIVDNNKVLDDETSMKPVLDNSKSIDFEETIASSKSTEVDNSEKENQFDSIVLSLHLSISSSDVSISRKSGFNSEYKARIEHVSLSNHGEFQLLGRGKFAAVFQGEHKGSMVAIKIPQFRRTSESNQFPPLVSIEEFTREVTALAALKGHSNIISIKGAVTSPIALVLEHCNANNLSSCLLKYREGEIDQDTIHLSNKTKLKILLDISNGLQFMHENLFLHRDIKPHNILLCVLENEEEKVIAKLGDFGSASKLLMNDQGDVLPCCLPTSGTSGYVAPEVLAEEEYELPSDIFAFAVIIWEVLDCKHKKRSVNPLSGMNPEIAVNEVCSIHSSHFKLTSNLFYCLDENSKYSAQIV